MKQHLSFIAAVAVALSFLAACQSKPAWAPVQSIALSKSSIELFVGDQASLDVVITPENATHKSVVWGSSDEEIATVSDSGLVSALKAGRAVITVTSNDGGFEASCEVTVKAVLEAVDLGLSVKWASFNLGASSPEEYGLYYQWGDTQGYGSDTSDGKYFNWQDKSGNVTYKWANGSTTSLTKYNSDSSAGYVDNLFDLQMEDDAARVALGGKWRIPTDDEWSELRSKYRCSWTWTTINGVNGYKVQSKEKGYTDNWIFLPAAGYRYDADLNGVGSLGYYWSSTVYYGYYDIVYDLTFYNDSYFRGGNDRCGGESIRPVTE